jgi:aspartate racemase
LYDQAFAHAGLQCYSPLPDERELLMHGIYSGVKVGNMALAHTAFASVATTLARRHGLQTLVLGCTEIPLALTSVPEMHDLALVDPAQLLAQALAKRAYRLAT